MQLASLMEPSTIDQYREKFAKLPGYMSETSVAIWDALLGFQTESEVEGSLLEIGVFRGRSAGMLALHADSDPVILVDPDECLTETVALLERETGVSSESLPYPSQAEEVSSWANERPRQIRFLHIDGEHTAKAIMNDLALADILLTADGILCLDDFFSAWYPQITFAACEFLSAQSTDLTFFLCGWNKGYLCRRDYAKDVILPYIRDRFSGDLEERGTRKFTLFKSDYPGQFNCFGIGPIIPGKRSIGPDSDTEHLPI